MSANKGLSSRAIIGNFYQRLEVATAASWVEAISMYFNSDQESETYKWLGQTPAMREWVGSRKAKGFHENGLTIENLKFEATLEIPVDWMRRDKTGQIMVRVNELADRTVTHWQSLLSALIANGESGVCYDGQFFFDTDHQEGEGPTQSNRHTVDISAVPGAGADDTPTNPSPIQMQHMILTGVEKMLGIKDDQNEPLNEMARDFLVQVPTSLWKNAAAAIRNPIVSGGDTNTLTNLDGYNFQLAVNPRLDWTDKIAIFRTDGSAAPLIRQEEEGVTVSSVAEGSELEFQEDIHRHGVKALRNVGYGFWQGASLVQAV